MSRVFVRFHRLIIFCPGLNTVQRKEAISELSRLYMESRK